MTEEPSLRYLAGPLIVRWPQRAVDVVSKLACLVLYSARSCRSSICPSRLSAVGCSPLSSFIVMIWSPSAQTKWTTIL